jgi:hypothetical protein
VAFAPNATGGFGGSLSVLSSTPATTFTPASVSLSGTGTPVPAVLAPDALTFPETPAGVTSAAQLVTVGNADTEAALTVTAVTSSSPTRFLVVSGGTCPDPPFAIAAGGFCSLAIAFRGVLPAGPVAGSLTLSATPATAFTPSSVGLSGTGGPDRLFADGFEDPPTP